MSEDQGSGDEQSIPDMEFMDNELDHFDHQASGEVENELSFQASNVSDKEYLDFFNFNTANNQNSLQYKAYENDGEDIPEFTFDLDCLLAPKPQLQSDPVQSEIYEACNSEEPGPTEPEQGDATAEGEIVDEAPVVDDNAVVIYATRKAQEEILTDYGFVPKISLLDVRSTCECEKSKCLKLYCSCFRSGVPCLDSCKCKDCENTIENAANVAFERELIMCKKRSKDLPRDDIFCNCKMSFCQKNYCPCFRSKLGCSSKCSCFNCKCDFGFKSKE